jgi:hypothetical protein
VEITIKLEVRWKQLPGQEEESVRKGSKRHVEKEGTRSGRGGSVWWVEGADRVEGKANGTP